MQVSGENKIKPLKADLHIHSVLSACSSLDMSPKNIVEKALEKKLDIIAVADHNTSYNCRTLIKIAEKKGIIAIPAMELTTAEEFHVVCLFKKISHAEELSEKIYNKLLPFEIDENKMGYQLIVDESDNVIKFEKRILNQASYLGIDDVIEYMEKVDGIVFFSHADKPYYSITGTLGFIPEKYKNMIFETIRDDLNNVVKKIIKNSDAHLIDDIGQRYFFINSEKNTDSIFSALNKGEFYYDA
ncbi:MAG: PHP domain-containing protein [Candidatus Muiribacteriota bacterium]